MANMCRPHPLGYPLPFCIHQLCFYICVVIGVDGSKWVRVIQVVVVYIGTVLFLTGQEEVSCSASSAYSLIMVMAWAELGSSSEGGAVSGRGCKGGGEVFPLPVHSPEGMFSQITDFFVLHSQQGEPATLAIDFALWSVKPLVAENSKKNGNKSKPTIPWLLVFPR